MKILRGISFVVFVFLGTFSAPALAASATTLQLEEKIAYDKGQFGALYAQCGSPQDQIIIGGSIATWKQETFRGYKGTSAEMTRIQTAFDQAVTDTKSSPDACSDWIKQAAATWRGIARLSQYGLPVASN